MPPKSCFVMVLFEQRANLWCAVCFALPMLSPFCACSYLFVGYILLQQCENCVFLCRCRGKKLVLKLTRVGKLWPWRLSLGHMQLTQVVPLFVSKSTPGFDAGCVFDRAE